MVAGQSVRVLNNPLLADIHQDGLSTNRTDVVREVLGRHAGCTVILKREKVTIIFQLNKKKRRRRLVWSALLTPTVEAMKSAHISAKSLPSTP